MRDLKSSEKNSILIFDKLSASKIIFYYRTPTTKERVKYNSEQMRAMNALQFDASVESMIEWGKKLITGFSENSFGYEDKPVSSDPSSEHYDQNWKKMLEETSSDLLMLFVEAVMGRTSFVIKSGGVTEDFFTKSFGNGTDAGQPKKESTT